MELELLKWLIVSLLGVATYFLKRTVDQMDSKLVEQRDELHALRVEVQTVKNDYLHKNDFREFKAELRLMFDEIKTDIKALRNT